jgi:ferrochelatase
MHPRTAVILFNLGGPDAPAAVQPFLQNLFSDPAIISLPALVRLPLARFISKRRTPKAQGIYAEMGGKSPILEQTIAQAQALEQVLGQEGYRVFTVMRYWHPRAVDVVRTVKEWQPERVVLLPLYPQFSTTTTASSFKEWQEEAKRQGLTASTSAIGCYFAEDSWIEALVQAIRQHCPDYASRRLLFSAHGLPEKVVKSGDPYQWQVEQTVAAVLKALGNPQQDAVICYQSRVGPLRWIGPATDDEIIRAAQDKVPVGIVPVAFVSEHSETLVELDIEYRHLAMEKGVPDYCRVPAVQTLAPFVEALATLVHRAESRAGMTCPAITCPARFKRGACRLNAA